MCHIDFFTEETSAKTALSHILPRMLPEGVDYSIFAFQGKYDLLQKLPKRLSAYRHAPLTAHKVVILIDRDNNNCRDVKQNLESIVKKADLVSKSENNTAFQVVTRVVIEELEAWYFGDPVALHEAYPNTISRTITQKKKFRGPDEIPKPSVQLHNLLKNEYPGLDRLPKNDTADRVSLHMEPARNISASFQAFYDGVMACCRK